MTLRVLLETAEKYCARRRKLHGVLSKEIKRNESNVCGHVSARFAGLKIWCRVFSQRGGFF